MPLRFKYRCPFSSIAPVCRKGRFKEKDLWAVQVSQSASDIHLHYFSFKLHGLVSADPLVFY